MRSTFRGDIEGLRGAAVLAVVGYHFFPSQVRGGFVGVDVFFVISGYLISKIILNEVRLDRFSLLEFANRRIRRIFPALCIVIFATLVFGYFALLSDEYMQLGKHILGAATFTSNFMLLFESGYFDNIAETKPLLNLWSLAIEEQFYLVWPILLLICCRLKFGFYRFAFFIILLSWLFCVYLTKHNHILAFYFPVTRFWELAIGGLLTYFDIRHKRSDNPIYQNKLGLSLNNVISFFGVFIVVSSIVFLEPSSNFPGFLATLPVLGTGFIILSGPHSWFNSKVLSTKVFNFLGKISYPLYLWHWPLLSLAIIIEGATPSITIRIYLIASSVCLAWLTYSLIETPIRFGSLRYVSASYLVAMLLVLGLAGLIVYSKDGFPERSFVKSYVNNKNELVRLPAVDKSCLNKIQREDPLFQYCRFSDANSLETVAVIGDSHAHVAFPGIADYLKQNNRNAILLANSSCPPYLGSPTGGNTNEIHYCKARMEQLLDTAISLNDVATILIFTRGPVYTTGIENLSKNGTRSSGLNPVPLSDFFNSAQYTVNKLTRAGKSVIFVTENPELSFHPNSCLPRPLKGLSKNCTINRAEVLERQGEYIQKFLTLDNATVVVSLDAFCPIDLCKIFDENGRLLYADGDHLSVAGSFFQAENLLKEFLTLKNE